jgi:hypothetical protein
VIQFDPLPEWQRWQYLQAMGIVSWLPNRPLCGATTGPLWQPSVGPIVVAPKIANKLQPSYAADKPVDGPVGQATAAQPFVTAAPKYTYMTPFRLVFSCYENGALVVNELGLSNTEGMTDDLVRLQTAVINAIGHGANQHQLMAQSEFNWPLVVAPHTDHSPMAAQQALQYGLQKFISNQTVSFALLLGGSVMTLLMPIDEHQDHAGYLGNINVAGITVPALCSHSLHQLFSITGMKQNCWQHLQGLIVQLASYPHK